jgi:3-oxoacyl-[acyl-carrier protein] reductase
VKHRILLLFLCALLLLTACGAKPEPTPEPTPAPTPTVTPVPTPTPEPTPSGPVNPLTGLPMSEDYVGKRPLAIMLSNIAEAQPQQGVGQADMIYEILAEGGITRMVAMFQEYGDMQLTGSVRSTRPYYLDIAQGHDAILFHAGGSTDAYLQIKNRSVTALDCVNGPYEGTLFWRDATRRANNGFVHSVVTSGAKITEYFPKYSFRTEHEEGYTPALTFVEDATPVGEAVYELEVRFSGYKTAYFTYVEESKTYLVSQSLNGRSMAPYTDGNNSEQQAFTNVLVLFAEGKVLDNEGRLSVDLVGSGEGYFICGGKYIEITWEKASFAAPFVYKDADGKDVPLGIGRSYVCVLSSTGKPTVTFED